MTGFSKGGGFYSEIKVNTKNEVVFTAKKIELKAKVGKLHGFRTDFRSKAKTKKVLGAFILFESYKTG